MMFMRTVFANYVGLSCRRCRINAVVIGGALLAVLFASQLSAVEWNSGIPWPNVPVVDPGPVGGPPEDAIVLFDGKDLSLWDGGENWKIEDGVATSAVASIHTKQHFGDCQIHVEWASPAKVESSGQGRGNSGVYIMDRYEVQILDSYHNRTYADGQCAAVYKQRPPLANVSRKPGEWQTYDIVFEAPRFNPQGELVRPAYVTVLQNGVLVQNHTEIIGTTGWDQEPKYTAHPPKAPLQLQFHTNPVRFRNIWIRELPPSDAPPPEKKVKQAEKTTEAK
jgi:hypothetical protein